jgi:hypothetical protein
MEMRDGLAGIRPIVKDQSKAVDQAQAFSHLRRLEQEMAEDLMIFRLGLGNAWDGFLGNEQHMRWGLWLDIAKGNHEVIFVNYCSRDFARDDSFKQRLAHDG